MEEWALILNDRIIKRFYIEDGQSLTIGRGQEADIVVDNTAISRQHCSLELKGGVYYLTDLYSLNGTKVNGEKVISAVPIHKHDFIEVSKFTLQPTENILAEQNSESYSISADDGLDQTIYINSRSKTRDQPCQHILRVISGSATPKKLALTDKNSIKVGKNNSCDIVISGFLVAGAQFFLTRETDSYTLIPLGFLRKTYLNDEVVGNETKIRVGDTIKVGGVTLKYE